VRASPSLRLGMSDGISRADLAEFMVDEIDRRAFGRQAPLIAAGEGCVWSPVLVAAPGRHGAGQASRPNTSKGPNDDTSSLVGLAQHRLNWQ
jgi:hypothetical protein